MYYQAALPQQQGQTQGQFYNQFPGAPSQQMYIPPQVPLVPQICDMINNHAPYC